ncbi:hypothetical protein [Aurantibacillus circumpalustris]|uniref:hypothetical protein n=1 Tax=Aurantibacillus circumpalustris TaxID=3036359 RepID=UPI00295B008E|nr:hypothetical protein [Aurantibacillus circumpalustris]
MDLLDKLRKYENLHIIFWLIKDTCWMLEFKWLGTFVMIPTLFLALFIIFKSIKTKELFLNTAIFFWISANSFWMMMEFFNHDHYKNFAGIPFGLGFIFIGVFYWKTYKLNQSIS